MIKFLYIEIRKGLHGNILHLCIFATLLSKSALHIVINFETAIMIDKMRCVAFNITNAPITSIFDLNQ